MNLADVLRSWRLHKELTVREAAGQVGLIASTYSRIERGELMDGRALAAVLRWMIQEG